MSQLSDPSEDFFAITPNDNTDLLSVTRGVYIGGSGDIVAQERGGESVTFVGLVAGSVYPFRFRRILATGTTATNIVGLL